MQRRLTAIDLFCGCGGLSLGLRRAGFKVIAAIDNDELSTRTFRKNHRRTQVFKSDIRSIDAEHMMKQLGLQPGSLDLLAGCPPCQGFSTLRTMNGGRDIVDPLNDLVFEFVRFIKAFQPKAIMMENVPGLFADDRLIQINSELNNLGYTHKAKVLNAENYGVPQRRLRMILIGSRKGAPSFALPLRQRRTVAQTIKQLDHPDASADPAHNYTVQRSDHVMDLIRRIPTNGGSRTDLSDEEQLECHRRADGFRDVYGRMSWNKPAPTITGGCINPSKGRYIHPQEDRAITLREAALLQGFPGSYQFDLSLGRYSAAQLIGNAFPPKFAEHHAREIYEHIRTYTLSTNS